MGRNRAYVPPETPAEQKPVRRVYVLPADMLKRLFDVGRREGCKSEVAIVRKLLDEALTAKGY